ncbi:AGAP005732-PA-like protein [Anopheles sinensis]|uniref:AGAP005732-PA-like protein n=1 Tax=Anopheles sinensis TaxID=74873 RepID=A0A084VXM7_ANOSI|nr:AGAP005732-PA-like protein [Anopheles sinensis]
MDDIARFKEWATKLGCPPDKLPPDDKLKQAFRGEQSSMFNHIIEKVRPRQEITSMKKNVLLRKLHMHKKMDTIVANASFNSLPPELQRYMKIQKIKKKIDETRHRIKQSQSCLEATNLQIKEKNARKLQSVSNLEELYDKTSLYAAYETSVQKGIEKEKQLGNRIERIMPIKGSEACRFDTAEKGIEQCVQLLTRFYENFKDLNPDAGRVLQEELWSDIRGALRGIPNHLLWSVLLKMKDVHLREISEVDSRHEESDQHIALSDRDLLQGSMAKLCTSHIKVFLDVVDHSNKVNAIRKEYLTLLPSCTNELEAKMALINVMDDEAEEALEEYLVQWNSREYNQGQLEYMGREVERKKQELLTYGQKLQNHDQLLAQLRGIYGQIDDISRHMEGELQQVHQIKQKIAYAKYVSQQTVRNARQKNGTNQTLNASELSFSRLESTQAGPAYNPAVLPPYVRELEVFRSIPLSRYVSQTKPIQLSLEPNVASYFETPIVLALLPCTAFSADTAIKRFRALQELETRASGCTDDSWSLVAPSYDHVQLEKHWQSNHGKICELLDEIETLSNSTRHILGKSRVYYNFTLANNLRKYVPPTKLFNGRSFREYESEYLMYYRMINGFGGGN